MINIPETHQDLLKANVAILSTVGPDGYPQVTALWFLLDDDGGIKLALNNTRQKVKNLLAHPECTFFVLDTANPYRTLEIRCHAIMTLDENNVFTRKLGAKYGGVDVSANDGPGESRIVVSLQPIKVKYLG